MKYTKNIILLLLGTLLLATSCELQKDILGKTDNTDKDGVNPDLLGALSLVLKPEKEAEIPSKADGVTGSDVVVLNMYDFSVRILDEEGEVVKYYDTYKELEEEGTIFLPAGTYYIQAFLGDLVEAGFNMPYYEGTNAFVISAKEVASVITNCVLANKKVTITHTAEFLEKFKTDYKIIMTNGVGVLTMGHTDTRTPYFKPSDRLDFIIHTTTVEGLDLTYSLNLFEDDDVASHNNILIDLDIVPDTDPSPGPGPGPGEPEPEEPEEVDKPTLVVNISLINREYVIEIPSNFVDPDEGGNNNGGGNENGDKPTITGPGLSSPIQLTMAQANAGTTKVELAISTPLGIKSLEVLITSTNSGFMNAVGLMGLDKMFDLLNLSDDLKEILVDTVGLPIPSGEYNNTFDITSFIPLMAEFEGGGTYKFKVTAKDKAGNGTSETLTIILTD